MLLVVGCHMLFVVCSVLFDVVMRCLCLVVCVIMCSLVVLCRMMFVVCGSLFDVCCWRLVVACCLLCVVCYS